MGDHLLLGSSQSKAGAQKRGPSLPQAQVSAVQPFYPEAAGSVRLGWVLGGPGHIPHVPHVPSCSWHAHISPQSCIPGVQGSGRSSWATSLGSHCLNTRRFESLVLTAYSPRHHAQSLFIRQSFYPSFIDEETGLGSRARLEPAISRSDPALPPGPLLASLFPVLLPLTAYDPQACLSGLPWEAPAVGVLSWPPPSRGLSVT